MKIGTMLNSWHNCLRELIFIAAHTLLVAHRMNQKLKTGRHELPCLFDGHYQYYYHYTQHRYLNDVTFDFCVYIFYQMSGSN